MTTKIILDCDPGHDDAVAMLLAHGNPDIDLLGVTTVGGNQTLDKVTHNAQVVATIAGIDAKIYRGVTRPLVRDVEVAEKLNIILQKHIFASAYKIEILFCILFSDFKKSS